MSWRIIKFETPGKLSFNNNRLCFHQQQTDQVFFFPLEDIAVVELTERDVVRHPLVMRIVRAYERDEQRKARGERK